MSIERRFDRGIDLRGPIDVYGTRLQAGERIKVGEDGNVAIDGSVSITQVDSASKQRWLDYELWIVGPAQSNWSGVDVTNSPDLDGADAIDGRALSTYYSDTLQSELTAGYRFPAVDELMLLRQPTLHNRAAGLCPCLHFAKRRLELNPQIKEICIIPRATGETGFFLAESGKRWGEGNALYTNLTDRLVAVLAKYPRFRFCGILGDVGASEPDGTTAEQFADAWQDTVEAIRTLTAGQGGEESVAVITQMPTLFRDANPQRVINEQGQRLATLQTDRATFVLTDGLDDLDGANAHFQSEDIRRLGRRTAEAVQDIAAFTNRRFRDVRMQYNAEKGRFADIQDGGHLFLGEPTLHEDDERGWVVDLDRTGVSSTIPFPNVEETGEYTFAAWFRRYEDPSGAGDTNDYFFGGRLTDDDGGDPATTLLGIVHARSSQLHAAGEVTQWDLGDPVYDSGSSFANQPNPVLSSNWFHLAFTYASTFDGAGVNQGGTLTCYLNGEEANYNSGGTNPTDLALPDSPREVQVGRYGSDTIVSPAMYMDDLIVSNRAYTAAEVAAIVAGRR